MSFLDYCKMAGFTPEAHLAASQDPRDLVPQPELDAVAIGASKLHGRGVFPIGWFEQDMRVGLLLDKSLRRTEIIGRWINHADIPNTRMRLIYSQGVALYANGPILAHDEITMNYYDTMLLKRICQEAGL